RQAIGNVPPGQHIDLEVTIDHPLSWVGDGWELRFPTVVAPRFQSGNSGSSTVPIALSSSNDLSTVSAPHQVTLQILDELRGPASSPSHALQVAPSEPARVSIAQARLDRDVVVRWSVAGAEVGARLETARIEGDQQFGLLTLLPPAIEPRAVPRDLIVLLDTSGSMAGEPLSQAVRVVSALVESLRDEDRLELIEFGSSARRWRESAVAATAQHKRDATAWLAKLRAGGGTEMRSGIHAALASLRPGALRQVVLVSDGLIGFEREVLEQLSRRLPDSCRFHSVGVGHGTNGSLLTPAARAGRGACIIVTPGEDVEPACARLLARTAQPLVVNLRLSGTALATAPLRAVDLYSGCPALVPLALRAAGGSLEIAGETSDGAFARRLTVEPREPATGQARLAALYARDRIEDLELALAAGTSGVDDVEREIEGLGLRFQIASRLTSWVAVSEQVNVDGTRSSRRVEQPQQMTAGVSAEGLGLRSTVSFVGGGMIAQSAAPGAEPMFYKRRVGSALPPRAAAPAAPSPMSPMSPPKSAGFIQRVQRLFSRPAAAPIQLAARLRVNNDALFAVSFEPGASDWQLPEQVEVRLADGSRLTLEVDAQRSTHSATLSAGQEVRLVCKLTAALPAAPQSLAFTANGSDFLVTLSP
ncbi:MAG TPA: VWA domain-containing protein, partial [Polyangiaceae bacterium]|nr:VWA domain-containing protein [Polyangiaceae bacterium]